MESITDASADAGYSGVPGTDSRPPAATTRGLDPRRIALFAHSDFARFWTAQTISQVGTQFTAVALPLLAALSLGASAMGFGLLATASGLPHLLFGLPAGAWVDRLSRRRVMILADLGRAALLAAVPIAAWRGALRLELLIAIAFLVETLSLFFDVAYLAFLPTIVPRTRLVDANSRQEATASGAQVVGPALAGSFVRWLGAPLATLVDAVSYLGSALFLWRIRAAEPPRQTPATGSTLREEVRQGLAAVWQAPVLRALALSSGIVNLAGFLFLSIYVLYMTQDLGLGAAAVGLVFAIGGIGALLGSLAAGPARDHWGVGPVLLGSQVLFGVFGMLVPLAVLFPRYALPLVMAAEGLQWVMVLVYDVNAVSLRQTVTPDRLLGRVNGTMRFLVWGTRPLGSLLGGYLGMRIGLPATLVVGAVGMSIAFVPLLASPIPRLRSMPQQEG
jgi:MFS family permease